MFTANDLILCHCQAQTFLLPDDSFLRRVSGCKSRVRHNSHGILVLELRPKSPATVVVKSSQLSECSKVYCGSNHEPLSIKDSTQISVVREQLAPEHLFDFSKEATAQVLLYAHANPEVLPDPVSNRSLYLACIFT